MPGEFSAIVCRFFYGEQEYGSLRTKGDQLLAEEVWQYHSPKTQVADFE
jgi:uncharacterized protein (DUF427 family)